MPSRIGKRNSNHYQSPSQIHVCGSPLCDELLQRRRENLAGPLSWMKLRGRRITRPPSQQMHVTSSDLILMSNSFPYLVKEDVVVWIGARLALAWRSIVARLAVPFDVRVGTEAVGAWVDEDVVVEVESVEDL